MTRIADKFSAFQITILCDWTTFDHLNTRLVQHSDPHCVTDYNLCLDLCVQLSKYCFLHLSLFDLWVLFYFVLSDVVVLNLICTP